MKFARFKKKSELVTAERLTKLIFNMMDVYGSLMERYPTSILDTSKLPFPKDAMKLLLKIAWLADTEGRNVIGYGYLHLAWFQDDVGDNPIACKPPNEFDPAKIVAALEPYLAFSEKVSKEMEVLMAEFADFKRRGALP
ncbi:MAG: hypothetical protein ACLQME_19220 [Alphaproteobacteria bacterium]